MTKREYLSYRCYPCLLLLLCAFYAFLISNCNYTINPWISVMNDDSDCYTKWGNRVFKLYPYMRWRWTNHFVFKTQNLFETWTNQSWLRLHRLSHDEQMTQKPEDLKGELIWGLSGLDCMHWLSFQWTDCQWQVNEQLENLSDKRRAELIKDKSSR